MVSWSCSVEANSCIFFRMESFWIQTAIGAIKALTFVCDVITFPVYLVLQRPWETRQNSRRIKVCIYCCLSSFACVVFKSHWMLLFMCMSRNDQRWFTHNHIAVYLYDDKIRYFKTLGEIHFIFFLFLGTFLKFWRNPYWTNFYICFSRRPL